MSRSLGVLSVDLVLRLGGFQSGMDKAARESERTLKRIQTTARGIGTAIAAGFAALGASNLIGAVVRNTTEAEDALRQLEARLKSTGGIAGVTSTELTDFAQSMSEVSTFSDDAIVSMQSLLLTFTNIRGDQVFGATEAILDFATALGTDLPSAAQTVGRALNDPVRGITQLRRAGIQFTEDQEKLVKALVKAGDFAGAQGIILEKLQTQYGGAAQAAAGTFGGALKQLENAFGDLLEADGGLGEASTAVQDFTELLRDPATVQSAQALTSGIIRAFAAATEAITSTVGAVRFLGEELGALTTGAAAGDIVRLQDQLELVEKMRNSSAFSRVRFFGKDGLVEYYSDEELDREMTRLKGLIDDATSTISPPLSAPSRSTGSTSSPTVLPPSEEFEKLSQQLQQQIALYGKTGEAAKVAYQIAAGQLDDLSESEQQRILQLAQQYDSLVASAAATKELEQAQKQLQQAYDSQLDSYRQQISLSGEVTELQKLRYEVESGGLKGITADQQAYLEAQAIILDSERELTEAIKEQDEARQRAFDILSDLATPQEQYRDRIVELNELLEQGALSHDEYGRAVLSAQEKLVEATDKWDTFKEQAARNTQDIIADTLINGFEEGADGVIKSFGEMLVKLAAQAVAADIGRYLFGTEGTGDAGAIGAIFSAFAGGFATGGTMSPGQWGIVGERGPELAYAGAAPLSIQPMSKGTSIIQQFHIEAPSGTVSRQTQMQVGAAAARSVSQANRRNN